MRDALSHLHVSPTDSVFIALYEAARRRDREGMPPPHLTGSKRSAEALSIDTPSPKQSPRKEKRPCFAYFSVAGCTNNPCKFSHKPLSSKSKVTVLSSLKGKNLEPDKSKF